MKKVLCIIFSIIIISAALPICVFAQESLPESEHNYSNDFYGEWTYSGPEYAKGLLVTFSEDTFVERSFGSTIVFDNSYPQITVEDVIQNAKKFLYGDYIDIYDGFGRLVGTYSGDELSGKTVFVAGNSFTITLTTDSSITYYGFKVTNVTVCDEGEVSTVTYVLQNSDIAPVTGYYYRGSEIDLSKMQNYIYNNSQDELFIVGWALSENGDAYYSADSVFTADFDSLVLYERTIVPLLSSEEIFYFNNSSYYFNIDDENRYTMSSEDYRMLQRNLYKTFGPGPLPNPALSIVLATYPNWDWRGSCYGISAVTALQHYGLIDILPMQGVNSLNEMELDAELVSLINYYQAALAGSFLTENKAYIKNSPSYKKNLQDLYKSVANGNICIFTFFENEAIVTPGHTILLTGAYTNEKGEHIILTYDCNTPSSYFPNYSTRLVISPDYSNVSYRYNESIGTFNWTDDFTQFKAFDINGNTDTQAWYKSLFNHFIELIQRFFEMFKALFVR